MRDLRYWKDFELDIIKKSRPFYIYGAGFVYRKIMGAISKNVISILDRNYDNIPAITKHPIVPPEKGILNGNKSYVLSCLNPFQDYYKRSIEVYETLKSIDGSNFTMYLLDWQKICISGILYWGGIPLLIDNLTCLTCSQPVLPHIKEAYKDVKEFNETYLSKLYEEPTAFVVYNHGIGLEDFNNGYIVHEDGKKVTKYKYTSYQNKIHMIGDSRVSGMLLSNENTISSELQKKIDEIGNSFEVINYGIPGRDIERMIYQVEKISLGKSDVVLLCSGFYEYDENADKNVLVWCEYLKEANEFVTRSGGKFAFVNLPTLLEMGRLSSTEEDILQLFHTTEFTAYSRGLIDQYKRIMKINLARCGILYIDLAEGFSRRQEYGCAFINLHHYGPNGSRLIADELFHYIYAMSCKQKLDVSKEKQNRTKVFFEKIVSMRNVDEKINLFLDDIEKKMEKLSIKQDATVGAIVMNANPFTNGHLYLVKSALNYIDFLICFIVEEDASEISFQNRFQIVKRALLSYENVLVVPSGKYCISRSTFPEYFKKSIKTDMSINASEDIVMFCTRIAPRLGISYRFVGTEPLDKVTEQYNTQMKSILPMYGIQFVEIERKTHYDSCISASYVRRLIKKQDFKKLKELVPSETYQFICDKYMNRD